MPRQLGRPGRVRTSRQGSFVGVAVREQRSLGQAVMEPACRLHCWLLLPKPCSAGQSAAAHLLAGADAACSTHRGASAAARSRRPCGTRSWPHFLASPARGCGCRKKMGKLWRFGEQGKSRARFPSASTGPLRDDRGKRPSLQGSGSGSNGENGRGRGMVPRVGKEDAKLD